MARAKVDKTSVLSASERDGSPVRVVRGYTVTGITSRDWTATDEALSTAGVPQYKDRLDYIPGSAGFSMLCHERDVDMIDEGAAIVRCTYLNAFSVDNMEDSYDTPFLGSIGGEVRCSIQQKQSNLDGYGNQIILSHTYPDDDDNYAGQTREQGGEISFFAAQRSFTTHGIKETNAPWAIANSIIGRVNANWFSGEAPRTWLCVACNWKPESTIYGYERYLMRFEFSFDEDTWDSTVVYIDDTTGKPPADLVLGTGIKTIQKLKAVDFEFVIGTWIYGG